MVQKKHKYASKSDFLKFNKYYDYRLRKSYPQDNTTKTCLLQKEFQNKCHTIQSSNKKSCYHKINKALYQYPSKKDYIQIRKQMYINDRDRMINGIVLTKQDRILDITKNSKIQTIFGCNPSNDCDDCDSNVHDIINQQINCP